MLYNKLLETYDNIKGICPVAHTFLTVHIGILIDKDGNFLSAVDASRTGELTIAPCTVQSEVRTNNIASHLIFDNYSYVGNANEYQKRHVAYIDQLENYVNESDDIFAKAVYKYVSKKTLESDLQSLDIKFEHNTNIIFAVYGIDYVNLWTDYYLSKLPKTDICMITGEQDYIPDAYPSKILSPSSQEKLFVKGCGAGYIASQKVIHALQFLNYVNVINE